MFQIMEYHRKRFILVGTLNDNDINFFEQLKISSKTFLKEKGICEKITIEQAIGDLLKSSGTYKNDKMKNFILVNMGKLNQNTKN